MGKFRKRTSKVIECESTIVNTRRGPQRVDFAIPATPSISSRQSSPSKKRTLSPSTLYADDNLPNFSGTPPPPKRFRKSGAVSHWIEYPFGWDLHSINQSQNDLLRQYRDNRQTLMFEMIRLEAPPQGGLCMLCDSASGTYRCKDCFPQNYYCTQCCLSTHSQRPFHRIQKYNSGHFEHCDLDTLGFCLDIRPHTQECSPNHSEHHETGPSAADDDESEWEDYEPLPQDNSSTQKTVIVASTGIFKRSIKWCKCPNAPKRHIQLLRSRLFPATLLNPKTAFTFEVLDHFRLDALECHTAALSFMSKLVRRTNEIFPGTVPVCPLLDSCMAGYLNIVPDTE